METRIRDVLDDYERNTYLTIRSSYDNMVKEISDAVNNVLTMTSFDFENSIKQGLIKVRNELRNAELLPKIADVIADEIIEERRTTNRSRTKKEIHETYEDDLNEEDLTFEFQSSQKTNKKPESKYQPIKESSPIKEKSNVQAS